MQGQECFRTNTPLPGFVRNFFQQARRACSPMNVNKRPGVPDMKTECTDMSHSVLGISVHFVSDSRLYGGYMPLILCAGVDRAESPIRILFTSLSSEKRVSAASVFPFKQVSIDCSLHIQWIFLCKDRPNSCILQCYYIFMGIKNDCQLCFQGETLETDCLTAANIMVCNR